MNLPTRPHAIFSTLQGTQNPDTKQTLQRAKNANAQPTHPSGRNSYRLQLNTSANNYAQHLSPPTTPRLTNIYEHYVENFSKKSLLNRATLYKFDKICQ
jgi:hypothetical protein